jgi:hypothetical protein
MHPDIEQHVQSALSPLRVSWSLMLAASFAWAALGLFASPVVSLSDTPAATPWTTVLIVLGVLSAGVTLLIDRAVITPKRMAAVITIPDQALIQRHLLAGHLVLWSFAQLPALFGFAQLLLDGLLGAHLALCAVSLAVLALLMPTRARIRARMEAVLR